MGSSRKADRDLVALAIAGDQAAMSQLLLSHHTAIVAAIRKVLGDQLGARVSAEDVAQQVYIDAFRGVTQLADRGEGDLRSWLLRIARNRAVDELRRESAQKRGGRNGAAGGRASSNTMSLEEALLDQVAGSERTPMQSAARREAIEIMRSAIKSLVPEQQQVLKMRYLQGLSAEETAAKLGKSPRVVHRLCDRAMERLRELMGSASQFLSS